MSKVGDGGFPEDVFAGGGVEGLGNVGISGNTQTAGAAKLRPIGLDLIGGGVRGGGGYYLLGRFKGIFGNIRLRKQEQG